MNYSRADASFCQKQKAGRKKIFHTTGMPKENQQEKVYVSDPPAAPRARRLNKNTAGTKKKKASKLQNTPDSSPHSSPQPPPKCTRRKTAADKSPMYTMKATMRAHAKTKQINNTNTTQEPTQDA